MAAAVRLSTDGGTSARVFGSFLSWLQDRQSPVFVVATANDVTQLPPELLRKGRFDELFFVDLPNQGEREAIWKIQIAKFGRKSTVFDVVQLAKATEGLTGSEIEQLFIDALHEAFNQRKEPTDLSVALLLNDFMPLSKLMSEQVDGLRKWAKGRARRATGRETGREGRKIAAWSGESALAAEAFLFYRLVSLAKIFLFCVSFTFHNSSAVHAQWHSCQ